MKRIVALILAPACVNAPAFELVLTDVERRQCEDEGGCEVMTRDMLRHALRQAFTAGKATCGLKL